MEKRTSFLNGNFTANEENEKLYIEGYFMKYNAETNLYGDIYEEIDKRSVEKSLAENNIRGLWNHDHNLVLGCTANNTLELRSDEIGNDIHYGTKSIFVKYAIPFVPRAAWRLTPAKASEYDIIVGMDAYNMADLKRLVYPADLPKICKMLELMQLLVQEHIN